MKYLSVLLIAIFLTFFAFLLINQSKASDNQNIIEIDQNQLNYLLVDADDINTSKKPS